MLPFCCQSLNKFVCNQHEYLVSMIAWIIQTPDRQYGVLTHIDDFKGFLTS